MADKGLNLFHIRAAKCVHLPPQEEELYHFFLSGQGYNVHT